MMWFCSYVKLFNSHIYVNIIQAILAGKKLKQVVDSDSKILRNTFDLSK